MNSDQARNLLLEYAYGELDATTAKAVREAIDADGALAGEYEQIARGRAAWSLYTASEPAGAPAPLPAETPAPRRRRWAWPLAAAAAAAAAAVVIALGPFGGGDGPGGGNGGGFLGGGTAHAAAPTIRRTDLAVTILSEPDGQNPAARFAYRSGNGLALVRDGRIAADLPAGVSTVELTGIPADIVPASVQMTPAGRPRGLTVLEQNYQYDLATAERVLETHIDSEVTVVLKPVAADGDAPAAPQAVRGRLLAAGAGALVLAVDGEPRAIRRRKVRAIRFGELPAGLRTRPTLVWKIRNGAGRRQRFTVSYLTGGLSWRADYNLTLRDADPQALRRTEPKTGLGYVEYFDTVDLAGWATVHNRSGAALPEAKLKLLAGDVRLMPEQPNGPRLPQSLSVGGAGGGGQAFSEQAFFEYHLYTLGRATTLADRQVKQLALTAGRGMRARRRYVYRESLGRGAVRVLSELLNAEDNGLGRPLPKGVVRLWAPDADGLPQQAGQAVIDHTPRDETLTFAWGTAFDISADSEHLHAHKSGTTVRRDRRLTLHNAKARPVTVTVVLDVPPTTYKVDCPLPWHAPRAGRIEIDVPLDPGQRRELTYRYTFDTHEAGWVQSPYPPRPTLKALIENTRRTGTPEPGAADRAKPTKETSP